tara:strand:- start:1182 stop:1331 length:150 start_codon:yes stop_codon:yes gene_type:complete
MVLKFKKPNGYVVVYDSNVHSPEYLSNLKSKFEEVKEVKQKNKKPSKSK